MAINFDMYPKCMYYYIHKSKCFVKYISLTM
jgi:hypothetical protein